MPNVVLERLREERQHQIDFIDELLNRVDADGGRDLVDAEQGNLQVARERIAQLDAQITPIAEFEDLREAGAEGARRHLGGPRPTSPDDNATLTERGGRRSLSGDEPAPQYRSAGGYLVDYLRARGVPGQAEADPGAVARITRANQTTANSTGVLPTPIIGDIVSLIDSSRPLITSVGARGLAGIPGKTFHRPKVTTHASVAAQAAEMDTLSSTAMVIGSVDFSKVTYGGTVQVSRQDIDWTSPSAWDALLTDLAAVYARQTEAAICSLFAGGVTQSVTLTGTGLEAWSAGLYEAAATVYDGGFRLPDRIWVSTDMWATLGALTDLARMSGSGRDLMTSDLASFSGDIFSLPRIVAPNLPSGTVVVGSSSLFEVYEEQIGLLSAIEPSVLGVSIAYGGYLAAGFMEANAFCSVTAADTAQAQSKTAKTSDKNTENTEKTEKTEKTGE